MTLLEYLENQYVRAIIILLFVILVVRPLVFSLEKIAKLLTRKTQTDLDDKFLARAYKPAAVLVIIAGIFLALNELTLSEGIRTALHNILFTTMVVVVAYVIYSFLDILLSHAMNTAHIAENATRKSMLGLFLSVIKVLAVIFAVLYALTIWGIAIGPFLAGLGIAGLAVALALQPTLSNIFSGIALILDQSVREGDQIYLDESTRGTVQKVGFRSTKIVNFDNELIIVPNSKLADAKIQNNALPDPKARVVIIFTVAYGSNIEHVKKLILKQILSLKHVSKKPEPMVRFTQMQSSALEFKAYYHVGSYLDRMESIDEANTKIYNALNKEGISIPYPQLDVHLHHGSASTNSKRAASKRN